MFDRKTHEPRESGPEAEREEHTRTAEEPRVFCGSCGHAVARAKDRIKMNGAYGHMFKNPAGIDYFVGTFREAAGIVAHGEASTVWSWFPSWAWRVAGCARCAEHLGWTFSREAGSFVALILDRVLER